MKMSVFMILTCIHCFYTGHLFVHKENIELNSVQLVSTENLTFNIVETYHESNSMSWFADYSEYIVNELRSTEKLGIVSEVNKLPDLKNLNNFHIQIFIKEEKQGVSFTTSIQRLLKILSFLSLGIIHSWNESNLEIKYQIFNKKGILKEFRYPIKRTETNGFIFFNINRFVLFADAKRDEIDITEGGVKKTIHINQKMGKFLRYTARDVINQMQNEGLIK
jgi:hypothetical protein